MLFYKVLLINRYFGACCKVNGCMGREIYLLGFGLWMGFSSDDGFWEISTVVEGMHNDRVCLWCSGKRRLDERC